MDQPLPSAQDHCRIQILVHSLGQLDQLFFNRIIHRLSRLETIEVSENPKRSILVKFVTNITQDHVKFSEFQFHRKIFGLVCIGQSTSSNTYLPKTGGEHDHSQTLSGNSDAAEVSRSTHSSTNANSLDTIKEQYSAKK